jgi:hypothetical protein
MPAGGLPGAGVWFCIVGRNAFREEISETDACTGSWNTLFALKATATTVRMAAGTSARNRARRENLFTLYTYWLAYGLAQG